MSRRVLLLAVLVAAAACGKGDKGAPPPAKTASGVDIPPDKGLTREQFVQVEIESECARLSANAELDQIDEYRETALKKIGKTRLDRTLSLAKFMNDAPAKQEIDAKVAECRKANGWVLETGPEGSPTWVRSGK